jgi:hypothetical protein
LHDVADQREYWLTHGPPAHITLVVIAKALGADMLGGAAKAPPMPDSDPQAFMSEVGHLPTRRYVAPQLAIPTGEPKGVQ